MIKYRPAKKKQTNLIDTQTWMMLKKMCMKNDRAAFEDYIQDVAQYVIADKMAVNWLDPKQYLKVDGTKFDFICPNCGETYTLDLKEHTEK